jgi:carboxypeptidase Taq
MTDRYEELLRRFGEISDLGRARALLAWDERTTMPPGGAEARAEQVATLTRVRHERLVSDELGTLIDELRPWAEELEHDSLEASMVRAAAREWDKAIRVPGDLRAEIARAASQGEHAWVEARERSDFALFLPHLERNVELARRYAECFEGAEHPYDPLLDDFEPEMTTAEIRPVLDELREGLRPLVAALPENGEGDGRSPLHGSFPVEAQERFATELASVLPLDEGCWRIDTTVHPFAVAIATTDVRLTTRYDETYLGTALWSILHEGGHGLYENGFDPALGRTPLCRPPSLGFHESQSRLWENWVGRGRPFLGWLAPRLGAAFPDQLGGLDGDALYRAANVMRPSLIRVEADELTYNLHIALRFELELEIFEQRLELADLPQAWNARVVEYLGVEVPDDAHGVLQDVHWAAGSFGYFPTYTLGNLYAAQIHAACVDALGDLQPAIEAGEFGPVLGFLRQRVHSAGRMLDTRDLMREATGRELRVDELVAHLHAVYGA